MVLPYALFSPHAPGRAGDEDGDVSMSRDVRGGGRHQSGQKSIPHVDRTCVSDLFFSEENYEALQQGVRYGVYKRSNGVFVIGEQSRDELTTIMRAIYLEHSRNLPHNLLEQVVNLNERVLEYAVPRVYREVKMYQTYRHDSTTQPVPLAYGAFTSRSGMRSLNN